MIRSPSCATKTLLNGLSRGFLPPTMRSISHGSWLERMKALTGWNEKKSDASALEQIDGNLYLQHMKQASKLGSLAGFARGQMAQATAQSLKRQVDILEVMTSEERQQLHILDPTVKERLIRNKQCTSGELEEVLRKFRATREVFTKISRLKKEGRPIPTSMEELGQVASLDLAADIHQGGKTKISRNAPCPCGSGKKYKRCCGR